jgi:hypothetical protein
MASARKASAFQKMMITETSGVSVIGTIPI